MKLDDKENLMASINQIQTLHTHEGGVAKHITPYEQLRRSIMACMLWENTFYESGVSIADRIKFGCQHVTKQEGNALMRESRLQMNLRHAPLWVACGLAECRKLESDALATVLQRPDQMTELLAMWWKDKKRPIPSAMKRALRHAFGRFDAYQLAKYDKPGKVKLRDVLFLCHPKPSGPIQQKMWNQLVDGTLDPPDTWEVALSDGSNKAKAFERLIAEKKLGGMAVLRNLRLMTEVGVPKDVIRAAILGIRSDKILPFRYIAAAKAAPMYESELEQALFRSLKEAARFTGVTAIAVDVSGSMSSSISAKSKMTMFDTAAALAMILREQAETCRVFAYGDKTVEVAPRRGFALRDALKDSNAGCWTRLDKCITKINSDVPECDRVIVVTDEQTAGSVPDPRARGYLINVAAYENGVGYGAYVHIDGWSEATLDYILQYELFHK